MLLPFLLAITPVAEDCAFPENYSIDDARPFQKAGKGLWIGGLAFTRADIAGTRPVESEYGIGWTLELSFTQAGNARFVQAQHCGVGRPIEISIDRHVLSRPVLNEQILGGKAVITGGWKTREEVEAVARRISGDGV
ncbi:hypothetical protein [Sphingomonas sp. KR3-1]|uniref:SecDF P1 head subdomain-containing protein n=1 Tax=Sphingomonas sp. KR3-1 TaxID=3156611 RepID=UPI0032B3D8F6